MNVACIGEWKKTRRERSGAGRHLHQRQVYVVQGAGASGGIDERAERHFADTASGGSALEIDVARWSVMGTPW